MVKEHQYHFEFRYKMMIKGRECEYEVPITAINTCYVDACNKVDEYVQKNFAEYINEKSTINYVGEFMDGVLKPFVEEVKN